MKEIKEDKMRHEGFSRRQGLTFDESADKLLNLPSHSVELISSSLVHPHALAAFASQTWLCYHPTRNTNPPCYTLVQKELNYVNTVH